MAQTWGTRGVCAKKPGGEGVKGKKREIWKLKPDNFPRPGEGLFFYETVFPKNRFKRGKEFFTYQKAPKGA